MTEYHWNEQPGELLSLLDSTPLDGFEATSLVAPPPLTDIFTSLEPASSLDEPLNRALLHDLQVPDLYSSSPEPAAMNPISAMSTKYEDTPVVPYPTRVDSVPVSVPTSSHIPKSVPRPPPSEGGSVELNSERDYSQGGEDCIVGTGRGGSGGSTDSVEDNDNDGDADGEGSGTLSSAASDVTAGISAVETARKLAEDFANNKVSERKRRLGRDDPDGKRRKGNDGSQVSEGEDDAPEKISHRKYQKRLQKNRDSAYVSRIRRREYTKRLEEGLNRVEKEKNELQGRYDALQRRFEIMATEFRALKEATKAGLHSVGKALAGPVGAARTPHKPKGAGALVTTMFMFALIFGFMVPESLTGGGVRSPFSSTTSGKLLGLGGGPRTPAFNVPGTKKEEHSAEFTLGKTVAPRDWWSSACVSEAMCTLRENVERLFGCENGGEMMEQIEARVDAGRVAVNDVADLARRSKVLVANINKEAVRRTLPSRRSKLFKRALHKMAQLADECFTKELVALLTIRMLPMRVKA